MSLEKELLKTYTADLLKELSENPVPIDKERPSFGIVVCPSPFTVPPGWEFYIQQPVEGASYIATVVHNAGYPVRIIDTRRKEHPLEYAVREAKSVDIIGLTTYEDGFPFIEEFVLRCKQQYPDKKIILGGSLVTSAPELVMGNTQADLAVLGEGELTILDVMSALCSGRQDRLKDIPGLCYRDGTKLCFSAKRPQMDNLDCLPVLDLSLWPSVQADPVVKEILFSHSRGCYKNCSFCFRTTPELSLKSVDKVREELRVLKKKHAFEFIFFVDLTFAIDKKRTMEICAVLEEFKAGWTCMCRVQNLDKEILEAMHKAGCKLILYGFESLDEKVLANVNKGISPGEIKRIVRLTQDAGIEVGGLFIIGLPGDTRESLRKMADFVRENSGSCRVKYLSAIPGTQIYRDALEKGIIKDPVRHLRWLNKEKGLVDDEFINFTGLPEQELRRIYTEISSLYISGPRSGIC